MNRPFLRGRRGVIIYIRCKSAGEGFGKYLEVVGKIRGFTKKVRGFAGEIGGFFGESPRESF